MNTTKSIRIVLADDHSIIRRGIKKILHSAPGFQVIGEAKDGDQALELVEELSPDVLVLDLEMPNRDGFTVARTLQDEQSPVRILVLSAHNNPIYREGMAQLGVSAYLSKNEAPDKLLQALRALVD